VDVAGLDVDVVATAVEVVAEVVVAAAKTRRRSGAYSVLSSSNYSDL
jgi:hypothetical protein